MTRPDPRVYAEVLMTVLSAKPEQIARLLEDMYRLDDAREVASKGGRDEL